MRLLFISAILFLVATLSTTYGIAIGFYKIWPYNQLRLIKDEIKFLRSDLFRTLERQLIINDSASSQDFEPVMSEMDLGKSSPRIALTQDLDGKTIIVGGFAFEKGFTHAALLLNESGAVEHLWELNEADVSAPGKRPVLNKFPHGFSVLPDGSIVFSFDGGVSLQRFDACSKQIWNSIGDFHHAVTLDASKEHVWTLLNRAPDPSSPDDEGLRSTMAKVRVSDGEIAHEFNVREIIEANPQLDLFGARQLEEHENGYRWEADALHSNDVDPLAPEMAAAFPNFEAGDLLVSFRSPNMVIVVDPDTRQVKWFTTGFMRRQHDPDWQADGTVTIYDNNMHREFSRLLKFDPSTYGPGDVIVDGKDTDFYTWVQGKHQITASGSALITIPRQGRVIEIGSNGTTDFEFINGYDGEMGKRLFVSEAIRVPSDYFDEGIFESCSESQK